MRGIIFSLPLLTTSLILCHVYLYLKFEANRFNKERKKKENKFVFTFTFFTLITSLLTLFSCCASDLLFLFKTAWIVLLFNGSTGYPFVPLCCVVTEIGVLYGCSSQNGETGFFTAMHLSINQLWDPDISRARKQLLGTVASLFGLSELLKGNSRGWTADLFFLSCQYSPTAVWKPLVWEGLLCGLLFRRLCLYEVQEQRVVTARVITSPVSFTQLARSLATTASECDTCWLRCH